MSVSHFNRYKWERVFVFIGYFGLKWETVETHFGKTGYNSRAGR